MKKIAYIQMYSQEMHHGWYRGTRKVMISYLKKYLNSNSKILDVGCGTGGTMKYLEKENFKTTYGIDRSEEALKFCRKRKIKNLKLGSINKLPYKDETFDAVICLDVLYHKGVNVNKALKEIHRVLKKGGIVYSQEPSYKWLKSRHDEAIDTLTRFTKGKLIENFLKSGFTKIKASYINFTFFVPILISRLKNKLIKSSKPDSDVKKLPFVVDSLLYISLLFESKVISFVSLPFGLSTISIWKK